MGQTRSLVATHGAYLTHQTCVTTTHEVDCSGDTIPSRLLEELSSRSISVHLRIPIQQQFVIHGKLLLKCISLAVVGSDETVGVTRHPVEHLPVNGFKITNPDDGRFLGLILTGSGFSVSHIDLGVFNTSDDQLALNFVTQPVFGVKAVMISMKVDDGGPDYAEYVTNPPRDCPEDPVTYINPEDFGFDVMQHSGLIAFSKQRLLDQKYDLCWFEALTPFRSLFAVKEGTDLYKALNSVVVVAGFCTWDHRYFPLYDKNDHFVGSTVRGFAERLTNAKEVIRKQKTNKVQSDPELSLEREISRIDSIFADQKYSANLVIGSWPICKLLENGFVTYFNPYNGESYGSIPPTPRECFLRTYHRKAKVLVDMENILAETEESFTSLRDVITKALAGSSDDDPRRIEWYFFTKRFDTRNRRNYESMAGIIGKMEYVNEGKQTADMMILQHTSCACESKDCQVVIISPDSDFSNTGYDRPQVFQIGLPSSRVKHDVLPKSKHYSLDALFEATGVNGSTLLIENGEVSGRPYEFKVSDRRKSSGPYPSSSRDTRYQRAPRERDSHQSRGAYTGSAAYGSRDRAPSKSARRRSLTPTGHWSASSQSQFGPRPAFEMSSVTNLCQGPRGLIQVVAQVIHLDGAAECAVTKVTGCKTGNALFYHNNYGVDDVDLEMSHFKPATVPPGRTLQCGIKAIYRNWKVNVGEMAQRQFAGDFAGRLDNFREREYKPDGMADDLPKNDGLHGWDLISAGLPIIYPINLTDMREKFFCFVVGDKSHLQRGGILHASNTNPGVSPLILYIYIYIYIYIYVFFNWPFFRCDIDEKKRLYRIRAMLIIPNSNVQQQNSQAWK